MWWAIMTLLLAGCSAPSKVKEPVKTVTKETIEAINIEQTVTNIERLILWIIVAVVLGIIYFMIGENNA